MYTVLYKVDNSYLLQNCNNTTIAEYLGCF